MPMPCKQIMKKISEKDLTDYLSFLSDFMSLSKDLLCFIPIPLSGTRNKKMILNFGGRELQGCLRGGNLGQYVLATEKIIRFPCQLIIYTKISESFGPKIQFHFLQRNLSVLLGSDSRSETMNSTPLGC